MGIPLHTFTAAQRASVGLSIPCKPQRAKRHSGTYAQRKAKRLAIMLEAATVKPVVTDGVLTVTIYLPLPNSLNSLKPWWMTSEQRKDQRAIVASVLGRGELPSLPVTVKLTRIGPKAMDKFDNLPSSLKSVVDAIAEECYGSKDEDPRFTWEPPGQEKGNRVGVRIEITGVSK